MDCRTSRELLCACVDEELEPEVLVSVHHHLGECPSCAEVYRAQRTVKELLHRSCGDDLVAPPGLRERVWAAVVAQCHGHVAGESTVTVNRTQTTVSATAHGVVVQRTTFTGTVVRGTYRPPSEPQGPRP